MTFVVVCFRVRFTSVEQGKFVIEEMFFSPLPLSSFISSKIDEADLLP